MTDPSFRISLDISPEDIKAIGHNPEVFVQKLAEMFNEATGWVNKTGMGHNMTANLHDYSEELPSIPVMVDKLEAK